MKAQLGLADIVGSTVVLKGEERQRMHANP